MDSFRTLNRAGLRQHIEAIPENERSVVLGVSCNLDGIQAAVWRMGQVELITDEDGNRKFLLKRVNDTLADVTHSYCFNETGLTVEMRSPPHLARGGKVIRFASRKELVCFRLLTELLPQVVRRASEFMDSAEITRIVVSVEFFSMLNIRYTKYALPEKYIRELRLSFMTDAEAAASACKTKNNIRKDTCTLVFDLRSRLYLAIITLGQRTSHTEKEIKDTEIAVCKFLVNIVDYLADRLLKKFQTKILDIKSLKTRLMYEVKQIEDMLIIDEEASVTIAGYNGETLTTRISPAAFKTVNASLCKKISERIGKLKKKYVKIDNIAVVGKWSKMPEIQRMLRATFPKAQIDLSLDPEEILVYGVTTRAAILSGKMAYNLNNRIVVDRCPLSLGIEVAGNLMSKIIDRDAKFPITRTKKYTTYRDNQSFITINILEGERDLAYENNMLASLTFVDLPLAPRKNLLISVQFKININGVIQVEAKHHSSAKSTAITIYNTNCRVKLHDVEKVLKEYHTFKEVDDAEKNRLLSKQNFEDFLFDINHDLKKVKKHLSSAEHEEVTAMLDDGFEFLQVHKHSCRSVFVSERARLEQKYGVLIRKMQDFFKRKHKMCGPDIEAIE